MKRIASTITLLQLLISFLTLCAQDAKEIIRIADAKAKGKSSESLMTIKIVRPGWTRELKLKSWTKGNDFAMILITQPAKDKGIVFLKRKKEVWNWIPSIERNIKLPPSMMNQSWMGTDFTNDDLVKEASIVEDYNQSIVNTEEIDNRICFKIQMIPKPEAAIIWGKVILWIDQKDQLILKAEYYDEENELINTMIAGDIKVLGGRLLPSYMEMVPADKKGNKTILIYHTLQFDNPIDDSFFSSQNMQRIKE